MPLTTEATRYLSEVAVHLTHLPTSQREAAIADLTDALTAGVSPAELGPPAEYAAAVAPAAPEGDDAPRLLGIPFAARRSPLWNPSSPKLFLPKQFGWGWTLNLGAVAVKLGWVRPDDADLDVLTAAPPAAWLGSVLITGGCEAVTGIACITAWRRSVDGQLPANWGSDGRPNFWADRRLVVGIVYAVAAGASLLASTALPPAERLDALAESADDGASPSLPTEPSQRAEWEDQANRSLERLVGAAALGGIAAVASVWIAKSAKNPTKARPGLVAAVIGVPAAAALGAALIPIRAGLKRVTR